ncbi:MAG: hypothetical protein ACXWG1_16140 [Usitatibacter sp.]
MKERITREDTGRVVAVAMALWAGVVAIAAVEGVGESFEASTLAAFAAFMSLYALGIYALDRGLRDFVARQRAQPVFAIALGVAAAFTLSLAMRWSFPAIFLAPLAALAAAALRDRLRARRGATSASSAKSPGATRAAT